MKVLVLNCGSSSLKYQLLDMTNESVLAKGLVEKIGIEGSRLVHSPADRDKQKINAEIPNHSVAIELVVQTLINPDYGVITDMNEIQAVGHRVVQGGSLFPESVIVDEEVKAKIQDLGEIAPLHNPPALLGIEACESIMTVPQVVVFDTSFHQTMPEKAYIYGLPYELSIKHSIRKYGAHGTSHKYVSQRAACLMNRPLEKLKIVTCHLGNGSSITAVDKGKSMDTSMGFTPLEGLMMGTRSGDLDPAIVAFLMEKENVTIEQINDFLNKKCGVLGVSGVSSDFRDVEDAAANGDHRAQLALDIFYGDVIKYIGSYVAALNGVDAIVFTAGLGENSPEMREAVCENLTYLGVEFDAEANNVRGREREITKPGSKVRAFIIPTNEELMIARETISLVEGE